MNPIVKFVVETVINSRKSSEVQTAALDLLFAKMAVIPIQRAFRSRHPELEWHPEPDCWCPCKDCFVCHGDCPDMSFLAREAARNEPNASLFQYEDGRMVPVAFLLEESAPEEPWCPCSNCAVCDGDCPLANEMSFLAREAARNEPNASLFQYEDGRMVAVAWKDRS
jgi:hypothetical protein